MMRTSRLTPWLSGAAALLMAVSCQDSLQVEPVRELQLRATMGDAPDSKTTVQEGTSVWWSPDDAIQVFHRGQSATFHTNLSQPAPDAVFSGKLPYTPGSQDPFWAVYPSGAAVEMDGESLVLRLPSIQTAADGTFADGMFPSVARSYGLDLSFYNLCGGIVFTVEHEGILYATLEGHSGENLSGTVKVSMDEDGLPQVDRFVDGRKQLRLDAPDAGGFRPGVRYFIVLPPLMFPGGFTLTFDTRDKEDAFAWEGPVTIRRARFRVLEKADAGLDLEPGPEPEEPDPDDPDPDDPDEPDPDEPDPELLTGLQYLDCYEMPYIDLANSGSYSDCGKETYGSTLWYNYNTTDSDQMVVTHTYAYSGKQVRNWTALIDRTKKAPLWSAFVMHKGAYPDNNVGRTGSWKPDPGIPSNWQQSSSSNGYSRGHFVASSYRQATSDANKQTFYYTNQALQYQNGFNGGIWSSLEQAVISNAPTGRDTLYVVVGILYEDDQTIGGVPLPSHFYKCLMKCGFDSAGNIKSADGVAYFFENRPYSDSYTSHATTIDEIEERSGWDFFAHVPASLQDAAESSSSPLW